MRPTTFRERLGDAAGWVMAGCGLLAVIVIVAVQTSIENALGAGVLFVGLLAGGFLSTAVHEFGHALAAHLAGWRVWTISVLGLVHRRGHGLSLSAKYSHDVGGYVLASPPTDAHDSKWRSIVFSAGGPLASLLTGPLFIWWLITMPQGGWRDTPLGAGAHAAVLAFGVASTLAALVTAIPSRGRGGRGNDMQMILDAAFAREPSADARGVAWAWALFEHGVEPNAWPAWMHESIARSAANPWASPAAPLLAFFIALQTGDETAAREAARRSGHPVGKLMRAYIHAYFDNNAQEAEAQINGAPPDYEETSLTLLAHFITARIATLKGDARAAERAFAAAAADLQADGPKPYWSALLSRAASPGVDMPA